MKYRKLGKTGYNVSEISLGTWQVGGKWGEEFNKENADRILNQAADKGINFIDTADVYGNGLSEQAVGRLIKSRSERIYIATKCGRRIQPHNIENYTVKALRSSVEDSLKNIGIEKIDIIQLHCPPPEAYNRPEIFELFNRLKEEGKIENLGVSVQKVDEALKSIEYPNVTTIQIIFNMFRLKPAEHFFKEAFKKDTGIIVRVPLASGLLTGRYSRETKFSSGDHRSFNRDGKFFDKGETFSGIDYEKGIEAVEELKNIFPGEEMAIIALKWILMFREVSVIIPGASRPDQVLTNLKAITAPELEQKQMMAVQDIYNKYFRESVHKSW